MNSVFSKRLEGVSESATLKLNALVQTLKSQGFDVINLTAGESDFHVPEDSKQAVFEAVQANRSKYAPVGGISELRALVAHKTNLQQPLLAETAPWKSENVLITNGGKQALFNGFLALLNPGDEAVIPSPYWLSYPEMVKLCGGVPKIIPTKFENDFKLTPHELKNSLTEKTKILVLNSPSNPTGAVYSRQEFVELEKILAQFPGVWIFSDEIYDRFCFTDEGFISFLHACPLLRDRTVTINGMSKSAAMTGWRVGWTVAEKGVTQAMMTIQGQSTSGINTLAQWGSVAALKLPESTFQYQVESFLKRRNLGVEILKKAGKIRFRVPEGAFYFFLGIGSYLREGEDSIGFSERLLKEANLAVVPGAPFGASDSIRLSFALEEHLLEEGCLRLLRYLKI